jgi:hypothetical protein
MQHARPHLVAISPPPISLSPRGRRHNTAPHVQRNLSNPTASDPVDSMSASED